MEDAQSNTSEINKQITEELKQEYAKKMQEKAEEKKKERQLEKEKEKEFYEMQNRAAAERLKEEQRKKDELKKAMELQKQKKNQLAEAKKNELLQNRHEMNQYFSEVDENYSEHIHQMQVEGKVKTQEYKELLKKQMEIREEAKRKMRQQEIEDAKKMKGVGLDASSKNPYINKEQYKQEVKKQLNQVAEQKTGNSPTTPPKEAPQSEEKVEALKVE